MINGDINSDNSLTPVAPRINNNNWERLDEICRRLGGRDDTWYATNGEIYEYTKAYESLVYSADGMIVYNPTLFEIFFVVDGKNYSIKPGETLKI